jgi:hypothetical protein
LLDPIEEGGHKLWVPCPKSSEGSNMSKESNSKQGRGRPKQSYCIRGHPLTEENVYYQKREIAGRYYDVRSCYACRALHNRKASQKRKNASGVTGKR